MHGKASITIILGCVNRSTKLFFPSWLCSSRMDDNNCGRSDYEYLAEIGEGAYGKVYKAREIGEKQRLVAVKKLNLPGDPESGIPAFMVREVALLRKIEYFNHPNIIK